MEQNSPPSESLEAAPSFSERFIQEVDKEYEKLLVDPESQELRNRFELGSVIHRRLDERNPQEVLCRDLALRQHAAHLVYARMNAELHSSLEDKHQREELQRLMAFFDALPRVLNILLDVNNQDKYESVAGVLNNEIKEIYKRLTEEVLREPLSP